MPLGQTAFDAPVFLLSAAVLRQASRQKKKAAKELGAVEKRVGYFLLWARSYGAEATPDMAADILLADIDTGGKHEGAYLSGL